VRRHINWNKLRVQLTEYDGLAEWLNANPNIGDLLNSLSSTFSDTVMQDLNSHVDVDKQTIEQVARDFLESQDLI